MKKFLIKCLQKKAQKAVRKHHPTIIGITGSVGKTSAKQAIAVALEDQLQVRVSHKNYNNEIGLPISILGKEAPGKSVTKWLSLLLSPISSMPEVIILEYGIDHPGDMDALCSIAQPNISVVTGISPVHAEFFADIHALVAEKAKLVSAAPKDGVIILNADNEFVLSMKGKARGRILTYGKNGELRLNSVEIQTRIDDHVEPGEVIAKTVADFSDPEKDGQLVLTNSLGYAPVMAALAALAVVRAMQLDEARAIQALEKMFKPTPGRLFPLPGIKGSTVIDDSYNAAPAAMQNGLEILRQFPLYREDDRRIAVLGSMAELGAYTEDEHRHIGLKVAEVADVFIAVGESMKFAMEAAKEAGMDEDAIEWFKDSHEAGRYLDRTVQEGDIVYVKGSQSMRMERVVKDIMAEPFRAKELLVRQEDKWLNS